ncbi:MAG: iron chelate uptake ABC transporter family permease subunit [Flavobacteriales bacterium]|jgi:manganese/zinc/iron transport system permease protein
MWIFEQIVEFFSFQDVNIRYVALGTVLLGASSATVGCFTFLRKKALVGDTIAHSILPGICLSFMIFETKDPLMLLLGAMVSGWLSVYIVDYISANSKIKPDTAIGLTLSVFFGVGVLLLTHIQHSGNAAQAGLDKFLFGKAASLVQNDVITFGIVSVLLIGTIILFFKQFSLISFDLHFAKTIGIPVRTFEVILSIITVLAVAIGIQTVGVVLMAAMLITPAAAARFWTDQLKVMIIIAAIIGAVSGLFGAFISYTAPSMPTGPWIVVVLSFIAIFSMLVAPKNGAISKNRKQKKNQRKILEDNIIKLLYKLGEKENDFFKNRSITTLKSFREIPEKKFLKGLKILRRKNQVVLVNDLWVLTEEGKKAGMRIVRIHRLWELYLTTYLRIAPDHVHEDAETIEHIITPEMELKLEHLLNFPKKDPHNVNIPYKNEKNNNE